MSGPQAKPFKGRLGFDANNDKIVNLADPTDLQDGLNFRYFVANNTIQAFDPARAYPAGFLVEYTDRLYKSKAAVTAGSFDLTQWTEIHAFGRWLRITSSYTAEPGDNLLVSTQAGTRTISLPFPADDGDIVTIADEGYAKTNPIAVNPNTNTINGAAGGYNINSQDIVKFVYLGGTWKVLRVEKDTFQFLNANTTVTPNSFNIIDTITAKTIALPPNPILGQWVTITDGGNQAAVNNITVDGNGTLIGAAATYVMRRYGEQATFIYDVSGVWKLVTNALERRIPETLTPLPSQTISVALDGTIKTMTLPTSVSGDWVEVVSTFQDTIASGSLVVTAPGATYFRNNGGGQNTTTFRIKRRGRTLFILSGSEWSVIQTENLIGSASISNGSLVKNTMATLLGTVSSTIYLPSSDAVQIGDYVTCQLNTSTNRVFVSTQNTSTDLIDAATTVTYLAVDNNVVLTYIYRGWNGSKYVWETLKHGAAYLQKTQNLADLSDKAVSRTNLDVFSKGESDLRFLGLHATADNALQAGNADKLDNIDSTGFIQVKNLSVVAVDANTTAETRFTTNTNTPDASLWQVVMFIDTATGNKSQLAMNMATSVIAFRVHDGSVWKAWSYLDQSANAATASKLATARSITLTGDATGTVSFDGSANVSFTTTVESAAVNLEDLTVAYASIKDGVFTDKIGAVTRIIAKDAVGSGLLIDIDNTTGDATVAYWNGTSWVTSRLYTDAYHPTADKWTTARTFTLTGGVTGSVSIDGSGNVSLAATVDPAAHTHTIAQVTGLQTALNAKLDSATGVAFDSGKLGGKVAGDYPVAVVPVNAGEDPSVTTNAVILTNHVNTPDAGVSYWYVSTTFYVTRANTSNRIQTAFRYNGTPAIFFRQYYSSAWSDWTSTAGSFDSSNAPAVRTSLDVYSKAETIAVAEDAALINAIIFG